MKSSGKNAQIDYGVGRNSLTLIHLVSAETATSAYMLQASHEGIHRVTHALLRCILVQPFAKRCVQGRLPRPRHPSCPLDHALIGAKCHIFHNLEDHTKFACSTLAFPSLLV